MPQPHDQGGTPTRSTAIEELVPDDILPYARTSAVLAGLDLADEDLTLTAMEFQRGIEIIKPLLEFDLPDRLDLAGGYKP